MKTRHTIVAEIEKRFSFPGLADGEYEVAYPEVAITYDYIPGRPAYTPRGEYGPIDPPEPAEVEFVGVRVLNYDGLDGMHYEDVRTMAEDWLNDEGYEGACRNAEI